MRMRMPQVPHSLLSPREAAAGLVGAGAGLSAPPRLPLILMLTARKPCRMGIGAGHGFRAGIELQNTPPSLPAIDLRRRLSILPSRTAKHVTA